MVCRNCGKKGDHWTARCPHRDLAAQVEAANEANPNAAAATSSGTAKAAYIPPSKRGGASSSSVKGSDMKRINNEHEVRVSNLSQDASEADLRDLFEFFGPLTRVHIVCDRATGLSRGFGFVNFVNMEDAVRAIQKLDGYGYDNLILQVEWAPSRSK